MPVDRYVIVRGGVADPDVIMWDGVTPLPIEGRVIVPEVRNGRDVITPAVREFVEAGE